jgi:hypothetical protein
MTYPNPADYPSAADYLDATSKPQPISKPQPTEQELDTAYRARMEGYAKRTAAGVTFLAVVTGILLALSLIAGIVTLVHINNANNAYNSVNNCQSLGGNNPDC